MSPADEQPARTPEMIANHQHWVRINTPAPPHWEVRGTGVSGIDPPFISDWRDLLTPNERERMDADLAEMARQRRRAEAESRHLEMP